jgi:hypothetical protein
MLQEERYPAGHNDPVALNTSPWPLKDGVMNFCAHKLVEVSQIKIIRNEQKNFRVFWANRYGI